MRLEFELVPQTCWRSNVRSQVTKSQWEVCKDVTKAQSGGVCEICGGKGTQWPTEAHEIWHYDDEAQIQTLVGLIALCPTCHSVKHIGRTMAVGPQSRINAALEKVQRVNNWSALELHKALAITEAIWSIRSDMEWVLDISWLRTIGVDLPKYVWTPEERKPDAP